MQAAQPKNQFGGSALIQHTSTWTFYCRAKLNGKMIRASSGKEVLTTVIDRLLLKLAELIAVAEDVVKASPNETLDKGSERSQYPPHGHLAGHART